MEVTIHYARPGKRNSLYVENLVSDDGRRLTTYITLPPEVGQAMSEAMRTQGLIGPDQTVSALRKHFFYAEHFDVLECYDAAGQLLGYYSDITTPLLKIDGAYYLTDLFLDLWLRPGKPPLELDHDEFETAAQAGLISDEQRAAAWQTLERLRAEVAAGLFPVRYIQP